MRRAIEVSVADERGGACACGPLIAGAVLADKGDIGFESA